jgi:hypothetical protein
VFRWRSRRPFDIPALGEIGGAYAPPFLEHTTKDADPDVRKIALHSIHLILAGEALRE